MSKQEYVKYKDDTVREVKGYAGPFVNIDYPNRANYFVPKSDVTYCDSDGEPLLSPSEGQQD